MTRPIPWAALAAACIVASMAGIFPAGTVRALEIQIEAPRFSYDRSEDRFTYEDGRLTLGELTIFAGRVEVFPSQSVVRAEGFIRFRSNEMLGSAERLELDASTGEGSFQGVQLFHTRSGLYLEADTLNILADGRLEIGRCSFTTCPADVAGWTLSASSLSLFPDNIALAWNPTLKFGSVPIFWLPFIAWPTVQERRSGVLAPRITQQSSSLARFDLGVRLELPIFVNLGVDHDLTVTPEFIEKRGLALELEYNYAFWEQQTGRLTLWGIDEAEARDPAEENDILPPGEAALRDASPNRYRVDWSHNQAFGPAARLIVSYRDSSDGQVRREYQNVTQFRPYRTYQASVSGQRQWGSAVLTFEQNADYSDESIFADEEALTDINLRPQLLPRLTGQLGGRLGEGFPLGLELGLSGARFVAKEAVSGQLYTAAPSITLPISLGGAFELRPTVTRHLVGYTGLTQFNAGAADTGLASQSFAQTEGTVELRTVLARVYPLGNGRYEAIKHLITPRLIFTGVEDVPQPLSDQVLRARVAQRLLTFRFDNRLLARRPGTAEGASGGVSELLRLNVIQRYNFLQEADAEPLAGPGFDRPQETEPGEPLLPLLVEAQVWGAGYGLNIGLNYHHQRRRLTRSTLGFDGRLHSRTRLNIGYDFNEFTYLTPDNKLVAERNVFSFGSEMAWSDQLSVGFNGRINLQDEPPPLQRRIDQGLLFVDFHTICYSVRLSYEEVVGSTLEKTGETFFVDRRVMLSFRLAGLVGGPGHAVASPRPAQPGSAVDSR
ncbi:MAG: LPS assembly protein LptD, partial [SAR324 cluster bacterium]|nr:LPS assembly protein LptD [SAR324 cluster bacterium]